MNNYLTLLPVTRINEAWINTDINCLPVSIPHKHSLIKGAPNSNDTRFQPDFYEKIALDIVAETVYNYPYPCITEKTLRPIACKKMFVIVGSAGVLKLLHHKGFRTFGDVIDESYDSIINPNERFLCIQQSILNFVSRPLDEIKLIVKNKSDVLDHNYLNLTSLESLEIKKIYDN